MTWITVKAAVTLSGRPRATIYRWIAAGHIRTTRQFDGVILVDDKHLIDVEPTIRRGRRPGTPLLNHDTPHHGLDPK